MEIVNKELQNQAKILEPLCVCLANAKSIEEKLRILEAIPYVREMAESFPHLKNYLQEADPKHHLVIDEILVLGQGNLVFGTLQANKEALQDILEKLVEVEQFYEGIGGIVGYHLTVLKLILEKDVRNRPDAKLKYYEPEGEDIKGDQKLARQTVRWGIERMGDLGEIYPIGGAGDRLNLIDPDTEEPLPVAQLEFCGRPLLAGLIRDLQGREYLHYKLFGKQLSTPIAMMTSYEKNNHERIQRICEDNQWFGRPAANFNIFVQPLVPVITQEGNWAMRSQTKLAMKPGGHGVMWKRALDEGIFDWFKKHNRTKALVRQINNPVAGVDNGLLALTGIGCQKDKDFGFASCPRLLNTAEGMNVLVEKQVADGFQYGITNIEYTEFEQKGIKDMPAAPGSLYSMFPSNTNILFIDLDAIQEAAKTCPIPGMIINMKTSIPCLDKNGKIKEILAGRLESTMQNIADCILDKVPQRLLEGQCKDLRTFLTYNERRKTISVTKQSYIPGKTLVGTPEGCFFDLMEDYRDLLVDYCAMKMPKMPSHEDYIKDGPTFLIDFHPALGGLFEVIGQKIKGGSITRGAEWMMEIAEADIENLHLEGSLLIEAENIFGKRNQEGAIVFGRECGKCVLKNIEVKNRGIDYSAKNIYWKHKVERIEALQIILRGNGEFIAENVKFNGDMRIEVPDGKRMIAYMSEGEATFRMEDIDQPSWHWQYEFGAENEIILKKRPQSDRI